MSNMSNVNISKQSIKDLNKNLTCVCTNLKGTL